MKLTKSFGLILLVVVLLIIFSGVLLMQIGKKNEAPKQIVAVPTIIPTPTIQPLAQDQADSVLSSQDTDIQSVIASFDSDLNAAAQSDATLDNQSL